MPLPIRPQRYCDPASLVCRLFILTFFLLVLSFVRTPFFLLLLVADTQLYKRLCPSDRPSVRLSVVPSICWSVRPSVRSSVRRSVRPSVMIKLKSVKTRIAAPAHPSATDGRVSGLVFTLFPSFPLEKFLYFSPFPPLSILPSLFLHKGLCCSFDMSCVAFYSLTSEVENKTRLAV